MSRRGVRESRLKPSELELLNTGMLALEIALEGDVVAVILIGADTAIEIVPRPGVEKDLFAALAAFNWTAMRRLAEEYEV